LQHWLDNRFGLTAHGSNIRREITAGLTTFLAMAYITVVNPAILSEAGMDFEAVFVATCIAAAIGSLLMGVLANYPIGLAPGMGQNAFFTYAIVIGSGYSWQTALGAVFISGVLFLILSVLPVREWLINSIPRNLKLGIAAGIGFFLALIAMRNAGIVVEGHQGRCDHWHAGGCGTRLALGQCGVQGRCVHATVSGTGVPATGYRGCAESVDGDGHFVTVVGGCV